MYIFSPEGFFFSKWSLVWSAPGHGHLRLKKKTKNWIMAHLNIQKFRNYSVTNAISMFCNHFLSPERALCFYPTWDISWHLTIITHNVRKFVLMSLHVNENQHSYLLLHYPASQQADPGLPASGSGPDYHHCLALSTGNSQPAPARHLQTTFP